MENNGSTSFDGGDSGSDKRLEGMSAPSVNGVTPRLWVEWLPADEGAFGHDDSSLPNVQILSPVEIFPDGLDGASGGVLPGYLVFSSGLMTCWTGDGIAPAEN